MIISIFASIWAQNLGDELILKNEIKILEEKYAKINKFWVLEKPKFIVFSYDKNNPFFEKKNIKYIDYFPNWIKDPKNIFKNIFSFFNFLKIILKSNLIIIWWGGIFYDKEEQIWKNPLDSWIFRLNLIKFFRKKIEFFRIWINIKNKKNLEKIKKIFSWKKNIISVRDDYSKNLLEKLWFKNISKKLDPVFFDNINIQVDNINIQEENNIFSDYKLNKSLCLKKINSDNFSLKFLENLDLEWKKIWIAFRSWYFSKSKNKKLEILIIKEFLEFLEKKNVKKIYFLPHSFNKTDKLANDFIWMKDIQKIFPNVELIKSIKDVYSFYRQKKLDVIFASRLHSIILSYVYDIFFIWVSYSKKTDEILKEFLIYKK